LRGAPRAPRPRPRDGGATPPAARAAPPPVGRRRAAGTRTPRASEARAAARAEAARAVVRGASGAPFPVLARFHPRQQGELAPLPVAVRPPGAGFTPPPPPPVPRGQHVST